VKKKDKVVTLPPKRDKDISKEPEFQELLEMMELGKVSADRTMDYLEDREKTPRTRHRRKMGRPVKHKETSRLTVRISPLIHERLREISEAKGVSINDLLFGLIEGYTRREHGKIQKAGKGKEA